jgi:seryl-tRNA synthetase
MLDIKEIRNNFEEVKKRLSTRGEDFNLDRILELDESRRDIISKVEELKHLRNTTSREIPIMKKEGKDVKAVIEKMRKVGDDIKEMDNKLRDIEDEIEEILLVTPNIPDEDVPLGKDESENVERAVWGNPCEFSYDPKAHWDIGTDLNILDFATASKITGARFTLFRGMGARLVRALAAFMIDIHVEKHGYTEVLPPYIVNSASMIGTGQLPKFAEDAFKIENNDYYLIPTAEVPVTNIYRDDILSEDNLPINYCAYSACFRAEAGAAGRDTRGLIRQHQFDKVEMVNFVKPEDSVLALDKMVDAAKDVLEMLELPYRIVEMCTGDLGISAAKKYDLEVWMPSYDKYVEISSCSNCRDYQTRRANIRFRREETGSVEFVHTLNGSGVAIGRCIAALLENHQQNDGSVKIPKALQSYMGGLEVIR